MATIILRQSNVVTSTGGSVKGSPLTNAEVDNNFANLNVVINTEVANSGPVTSLTTNFKGNLVFALNELRSNLTSSAGLASLIGDETGTGNVVYDVTPIVYSPSILGTPTTPTAANATSNTMIASTQFVNNQIQNAPSISSATLTGTTQAVTAANGTSNAMVATTQFVNNEINDSPTITNATLIGTPQAVTAANGTSNSMVATTSFVNNEIRDSAVLDTPTLNTPTLNSPSISLGSSSFATVINSTLVNSFERANIRNEVCPSILNIDLLDNRGAVVYFTANATANVAVNFRANATTTVDQWLGSTASNANVATSVIMITTGSTPFYVNNVMIDGRIMHNNTVRGNLFWQGNTLTVGGTATGIDVYSFTLIKNGGEKGGATYSGNVYTILAGYGNFKSFLS